MLRGRRVGAVVAVLAALALAGGCREPLRGDEARGDRIDREAPIDPGWVASTLPAPDGGAERLMVRDVAACADRWFLVGGAVAADGTERPVAWRSGDGRSWEPLAVDAESFYGRRAVLYAVACRDGRLAALGARAGGVHGNPRVTGWRQTDDGFLAEVPAPFELFGGPTAASVARMAGGPSGWLIVGNRISGAAAWVTGDPAAFEIVEAAPGLASDAAGRTWAFDATAGPGGWLAVGGIGRSGRVERDPVAWVSRDGRGWQRQEVPAITGYDELQRVTVVDGHRIAVGPRGTTFGTWRDDGSGWVPAGRFGSTEGGGTATVSGLVGIDGQLYAAVSDGTAQRLWISDDEGGSWRPMRGPVPNLPAGAARAVTLGTQGHRLVLAVDDGTHSTLWSTGTPVPG
ncbi:hypothetical protein [Plantactinospora soyae]|uniref:Exo-alpha-sialidase n=1 Tax=Plantactinospora soyae TaxID=1544732 RepID=A0A927MEJ6_9ACTN|nr:hypothetical protein [Plantactinospora soyae]MBE1492215.1 hypothetical protein [Plantactinospora soyae]